MAVYLKGKKLRKSHEYSAQLVVAVYLKEKNSENPMNIVRSW